MARFIKGKSHVKHNAPGTPVFMGKKKVDTVRIQLMSYSANQLTEKQIFDLDDLKKKMDSSAVNWVNVYGLHDTDIINQIGQLFSIPNMILEDVLDTDQRPKYISTEKHDIIILKALTYQESERVQVEQITLILGENYLFTFQEKRNNLFDAIRDRIRTSKGKVRFKGPDFLAYLMIDTVVDNYTEVIETIGGEIEELELNIFKESSTSLVEEFYRFKTEINFLRKAIRPLRDIMIHVLKGDESNFNSENAIYLNDLNDLVLQSNEALEMYSNMVSDSLNIYNANLSNRSNQIMKTLTMFASIFIPLTFLAGVYGMNFKYFPELALKYGYLFFWLVSIGIFIGLMVYFKRKKWL